MSKRIWIGLVATLTATNILLLWLAVNQRASGQAGTHFWSTDTFDFDQGKGTHGAYPRFGEHRLPGEGRPPLTLAIFCSAKSDCPSRQIEFDVFKRLVPVFGARNQRVVVAATIADSARIAYMIDSLGLHVPMVAYDSASSLSLEPIGISYECMPAMILYDSALIPIYMRGSDPTPESQADFENAMLWLSELYAKRSDKIATTK